MRNPPEPHRPCAAIVRHVAFEDLGTLQAVLDRRGFRFAYFEAGVDELDLPMREADLVIVLGGPIGVYEEARFPFIADEIAALRHRLFTGRATLGICLGAQLMAAAMGARVYPGGVKEIGWSPLDLAAVDPQPLLPLGRHAVLHWHGDTFDLPTGAVRLASTAAYPNQAFAVGTHALALQFHIEAEPRTFERWLIGHHAELMAAGIGAEGLRAGCKSAAPVLADAAAQVFDRWLDGALSAPVADGAGVVEVAAIDAEHEPELCDADIIGAMGKVSGYLDISTEDFREVYHLAWRHAVERLRGPGGRR